MKVLITGSKGFIGKHLTSYLREMGYNVTELSRRLEEDIEPQFRDQNIVVHLAAKLQDNAPDLYKVNVEGTEKVAKLCLKYNCKLINMSSDLAFDHNPYGQSKGQAEKAVEKYMKQGLKAITLRPCSINENSWYPVKRLCEDIGKLIEL